MLGGSKNVENFHTQPSSSYSVGTSLSLLETKKIWLKQLWNRTNQQNLLKWTIFLWK